MKRAIISLLLFWVLYLPIVLSADLIKETYTYAVKDGVELKLDKYVLDDNVKNKPCAIFLFGGGFVGGQRDRTDYLPYFQSLAKNGNVVVSMDYRLGLKNLDAKKFKMGDFSNMAENIISLFHNTLAIATEDLIDVTLFILDREDEWNIDSKRIVVSGSSAGAITALHGEYATCNKMGIANRLPSNFRYAGVISMAGAIFSFDGDLKWNEKPAPFLLFHGSADRNVPYNTSTIGNIGFYGSRYIANQLDELKTPYYFYDEEYGTHSLSSSPMRDRLDIINAFIKDEVVNKEERRVHMEVKYNDRDSVNTEFSLFDYFLYNFSPSGIEKK